ncbi:MAG: hypothetical protein HYW65_02335 [Candidatus Liptonbacteria bacterium]|nr:hypothetical protein [Candidatus Liptonbacteria bacterium]
MQKEKLVEELKEAKRSVLKRMTTYIGAGFGLVVGLAWNDAIAQLIRTIFPTETDTLVAKFVYALLLTLIVGFALYYVEKLLSAGDEKK